MTLQIRPATPADVAAMVALSEQKRTDYAAYQPVFWRKAAGSAAVQTPYFRELLGRDHILARVAVDGGTVVGFVIAAVMPAPAVYDPGGLTCLIDDFCVADPAMWTAAGAALLTDVQTAAAARGAVQSVVVCGHLDAAKRAFLRGAGLSLASKWYVGPTILSAKGETNAR